MERNLSKEDQQTPVVPSPHAQLKPANRTGLRIFSGEMYQLGSCEVTGQDWLLQGENYSTLVSLCQGIVDVAYRRPRSSGHVRHIHEIVCITTCSKVNTGNCLWTFFIKVLLNSPATFHHDIYSLVFRLMPSLCNTRPFAALLHYKQQKTGQRKEKEKGEGLRMRLHISQNYCTHTNFLLY